MLVARLPFELAKESSYQIQIRVYAYKAQMTFDVNGLNGHVTTLSVARDSSRARQNTRQRQLGYNIRVPMSESVRSPTGSPLI